MERALVIGGKGFIGGAVTRLLRASGYDAATYDLVDEQNVNDIPLLEAEISGSTVVFDCAGILGSAETFDYIRETVAANVNGVLNVLEVCEKYHVPMVFMSLKNDWNNPYMITKHAATRFCLMYHEYRNLPVAVIRGLNAYGPGQHWGTVRKVVPTFCVKALNHEPLTVYGDGKQIADMIYVDDLAEVMIRAWEKQAWGQVIDGGTGVPVRIIDLAKKVIALTDSDSRIEHAPMRPGEPEHAIALADPVDMVRKLGFYPHTSLDEGLAQTVTWYRENWKDAKR